MKQTVKAGLFFLCFFLIFGCTQKTAEGSGNGTYAAEESAVMADAAPVPQMMKARTSGSANMTAPVQDKKIVYRANLTIETTDLVGARDKVLSFMEEEKGILEYNEQNEQRFYFSIKVPADQLTSFLDEVKAVGRVTYSSITSEDVTEQYIDTETRLAAKRALLEKYRSYLPQAADLKEIMEVERQINTVTSEIEQWEGRMKRLEKEIAYSSVTVNLQLPSYADRPDSSETLKELFLGIGKTQNMACANLGLGLLDGVAVGGPFLAAALLIKLCVRTAKRKRKRKK